MKDMENIKEKGNIKEKENMKEKGNMKKELDSGSVSNKIENKKPRSLSTMAIILVVLGIIILICVVIWLTQGWDKILGWFTGGVVSTSYVSQCNLACENENVYAWCTNEIVGGKTCVYLADERKINDCPALQAKCRCSEYPGKIGPDGKPTTGKTCSSKDICPDPDPAIEGNQYLIESASSYICCKVPCV